MTKLVSHILNDNSNWYKADCNSDAIMNPDFSGRINEEYPPGI